MYDQSENESSHSIDLLGLKVFQSRLHHRNVFTPGCGQRRPRVEPLALLNPELQRADRALDRCCVACPHDRRTFRVVVAAHYRSSHCSAIVMRAFGLRKTTSALGNGAELFGACRPSITEAVARRNGPLTLMNFSRPLTNRFSPFSA